MGVVDVFAKWLLEKIDRKFLKKKDFTVEERVQALHEYLSGTLNMCKSLTAQMALYANRKSPLWAIKDIEYTEYHIAGIKQCQKASKSIMREINKHVGQLRFFFERDEFPELADNIIERPAWTFVYVGRIKRMLSDLKLALDADDESRVRHTQGEISKWIDELTKMGAGIKMTIRTLLAFAIKIKE